LCCHQSFCLLGLIVQRALQPSSLLRGEQSALDYALQIFIVDVIVM